MGKLSRTKGASGEREAAKVLSAATGKSVERYARIGKKGFDLIGLRDWAVEVKNGYKVLSQNAWWAQAIEQASDMLWPMLMYRRYGSPRWIIRIPARYLNEDVRSIETWVEMEPAAFGELVFGYTQPEESKDG